MTGKLSFQVALTTGTDNFVAALYDTSNPTSVIEFILIPKTSGIYPPNFQVTFVTILLLGHVYRCILWETAGTTPGGTSRGSVDFDASVNSVNLQDPLYLTADVSPGMTSGTNTITDSRMIGWDIWLDIPGTGPAFPGVGVDYTFDPVAGVITYFLGNWNPGQRAVVFFNPQIAQGAPPPVSAISSGEIITASRSLLNTDKNKAIFIQSAFSSIVCPLPALSTLTDYDHIVLYLSGGSHINAVFPANGSDKIQYNSLLTQLIGRQGEKIDLFKANGVWNIDTKPAGMDAVGEIVDKYSNTDLNLIFANGALLSRTLYPALFAYAQGLGSAICTEVAWSSSGMLDGVTFFPNKGKWTMGDGSTTFRIPMIYNSGFRRAVDGVSSRFGQLQYPGNSEVDMALDHNHDTLTGLFGSKPNGYGPVKTSGTYAGTVSGATDLTGGMFNNPGAGNAGTAIARRGPETHPTNLYVFASIRI